MPGNANYSTAVLTATFQIFLSKTPKDAIFNDLPLFAWLNSKGKIKRKGGTPILTPLMYGKSSAVGSYQGYDLLDVSPQEGLTNAQFTWKQYYATVTISGKEELENSGEGQQIDLLEAKWAQAKMSLEDKLDSDSFLDGTGNGGLDITGLALAVDSAGTYGNIARSTNTWWSAQETAVGGVLAIGGTGGMRRIYNDCAFGRGKRTPDLILAPQICYEAYEALMDPYMRYSNTGDQNVGFKSQSLRFRDASMFYDEYCQSGVMYFLNSEYINFLVHPERDMHVGGFQTPPNQDAKSAKILEFGEITVSNCRHLGKLTGITNT